MLEQKEAPAEFVAHPDQLSGSRLVQVVDGSGAGQRIIEVWTKAGLHVEVLPDRGFDLYTVRYRGVPISWAGPAGLRAPQFHEPAGFGWLRTFHGGLLSTCGLDHFGNPVERGAPEFLPPDDRAVQFGEHGRIGHQIADITRREMDNEQILLCGQVRQAALYSEQLVLHRTVRVLLDEPIIEVTDRVTNAAPIPTRVPILYHINFGFPLVQPGTTVKLRSQGEELIRTFPRLEASAAETVAPVLADISESGYARVEVADPAGRLGVRLDYGSRTLPNLVVWELPRSRTNVLGLAPSSASVPSEAPVLSPDESIEFKVRFQLRG